MMGRYRYGDEGGFSLIELMIVVLIIGILIAIALPTFLGAKARASDRASQEDLRTAMEAALVYHAGDSTFTGFNVAEAQAVESSLRWVLGVPPAQGEIDIEVAANQDLLLVGQSRTGTYFCVARILLNPATLTGHDAVFANVDTVAECTNGW